MPIREITQIIYRTSDERTFYNKYEAEKHQEAFDKECARLQNIYHTRKQIEDKLKYNVIRINNTEILQYLQYKWVPFYAGWVLTGNTSITFNELVMIMKQVPDTILQPFYDQMKDKEKYVILHYFQSNGDYADDSYFLVFTFDDFITEITNKFNTDIETLKSL
jgi:hypothetical protein